MEKKSMKKDNEEIYHALNIIKNMGDEELHEFVEEHQ